MLEFLLWGFDLCFWWFWLLRWFVEQFVKGGNAFLYGSYTNYSLNTKKRRRKRSKSMSSDSSCDSDSGISSSGSDTEDNCIDYSSDDSETDMHF